jgi:hypothetical protein
MSRSVRVIDPHETEIVYVNRGERGRIRLIQQLES